MLSLLLSYASRNLVLALGLSSALHAAVLSSLETPLPSAGASRKVELTVHLNQKQNRQPAAPVARQPEPRPSTRSPTAVLSVRYLPAHALDTPARPRVIVPLVYPENALNWKLAGVVRLRLLINEHGTVDAAEVVRSEPEGEFEEAALDAARRVVYEPARRNGQPVASEKLIEVTFNPDGAPSR